MAKEIPDPLDVGLYRREALEAYVADGGDQQWGFVAGFNAGWSLEEQAFALHVSDPGATVDEVAGTLRDLRGVAEGQRVWLDVSTLRGLLSDYRDALAAIRDLRGEGEVARD